MIQDLLVCSGLALVVPFAGGAIFTRHDVELERYEDLAAEPRFEAVAAILRVSPAPVDSPAIERMNAAEATLALARHTVASRLFDREPLSEHLRFCADVAASGLAGYRLLYPHRPDAPARVHEQLQGLCRELAAG